MSWNKTSMVPFWQRSQFDDRGRLNRVHRCSRAGTAGPGSMVCRDVMWLKVQGKVGIKSETEEEMLVGGEGKNTPHGSECVKALQWGKGYTCEDRTIFRYGRPHKVRRRGHEMSLETLAGLWGLFKLVQFLLQQLSGDMVMFTTSLWITHISGRDAPDRR